MTRSRIPSALAIAAYVFTQASSHGTPAPSPIHPIVELSEQCLIGGAQDQKWIAAERFQKTLKSPQTFNLYTLQGPAGEIALTKKAAECHESWTGKSSSGLKAGIAIQSPSWNPMPRLPRPIDPKDPTYVQIVSDILKTAGITKPEVKISQAYIIDLDGDGNDEVVIVANRFAKGLKELSGISSLVSPGDYTLVLVRKTINDKAQNIFIVKAVWPKGTEGMLLRANHLSAIADLNGDGVMEVVLYNAYYEGSASDALQIKAAKAVGVLGCSCEH